MSGLMMEDVYPCAKLVLDFSALYAILKAKRWGRQNWAVIVATSQRSRSIGVEIAEKCDMRFSTTSSQLYSAGGDLRIDLVSLNETHRMRGQRFDIVFMDGVL